MMIKKVLFSGLLLLFLAGSLSAQGVTGLDTVRERVITTLLAPPVDATHVKQLIKSQRRDGSWPDINYRDVSRTGFLNGRHLDNLVVLSRAYKQTGSPYRGEEGLKKVIWRGLDYWLKNDFICENWWWNQIGTPSNMVNVLLIMDKDLQPRQVTLALPIVGRANMHASGARPSGDRIRIAGILAKKALFIRDKALFDSVITIIAGELKFVTGRGLQYDYSFHHRKDKVTNTISYGRSYAYSAAEWASYVAGTEYAFPQESLKLLTDYFLDGICRTLVFGKYPDPGAKNRSISRPGALRALDTTLPENLLKATSYRKEEVEEIIRIRKGEAKPARSFSVFFWLSEYYSHQRPGYFTSVRMFSSRNHNMEEPYNSEGLMNHHLGNGNNFISRTGTEYYDIFPVYDWQKIPGTTVVQRESLPPAKEVQKAGLTDFVGAVTDGQYGAAAFDFRSPFDPLSARKAWFFFDREYVCLGAGIRAHTGQHVVTTLNQCLLKGTVTVKNKEGETAPPHGLHHLAGVEWVYHDSIAYLFPQPVAVVLKNDTATGSWYRINHQSDSPKEKITKEVFGLWTDHGVDPVDGMYQYVVMPSVSLEETRNIDIAKDIRVLSNTLSLQVVLHRRLQICQIVFYDAGKIKVSDKVTVSSETPGMVMVRMSGDTITEMAVADPARNLKVMHVTVSGNLDLKEKNRNVGIYHNTKKGVYKLTLLLPQGAYAGKSVVF